MVTGRVLSVSAQLFLGQRSHSLFSARIGESTAAYQSPSKDLSFINGRLQQRHPFRTGPPNADSAGPAVVLQTLDPNSVRATRTSQPAFQLERLLLSIAAVRRSSIIAVNNQVD